MVLVDTNVIAALLIRQLPSQPAARELYGLDSDWCTESHAPVEMANVLKRYVRVSESSLEQATGVMRHAEACIGDRLLRVEHVEALRVACACGVSAYDARFLVAAMKLDMPLVTEDAKLRAAAPDLTCSINEAIARVRNRD